ncbi:hypothetical protein HPB47_003996 [Ixodes persulcatus]|uniref:Uncharacterized protein n=1 Tax=Ixodes persulcatus TaxID=34615 RepID=A0AC60PH02_IXOPE|nr:hypothetical protein HPB47_003996 [Ixodes persulcatus]
MSEPPALIALQETNTQATLVHWDHFRTLRENKESGPIIDIEQWTKQMVDDVQTTEHLPEDIPAPSVDARLASLWRRYSRTENEWRKQKHNRELKLQLAALHTDIEEHALTFQRSQWDDICDRMQGSLGMRSTWQLLRHLLDPTTGRTEQRLRMTTLLHKYPGTDADLIQEAQEKYLPDFPTQPLTSNPGIANPDLDRDFTHSEIRAAIFKLRTASAAGLDHVTNKVIRNMDTPAIPGLHHSMYADDITLWVTKGSDAELEETLKLGVHTVCNIAAKAGLACSPTKSALLSYHLPQTDPTLSPNIRVCVNEEPAEYGLRPAFAAVAVTSTGQVKTCATVFTASPEQAEEAAIALALTATPCPKLAHSTARGYTVRAGWTQSRDRGARSARERLVGFYDITSHYRLSRRLYPPATQALSREESVMWRQLQTHSFPSPLERWDAALRSSDPTIQLQVVRRAAEVAEAHGLPATRCG